MRKRILLIFGTRPEAIKMAPLVKEFQKFPEKFDTKFCVTAQHREMLDQVLDFFELKPDYDLDLMKPSQNLYTLTATIIESLKPILEEFSPGYVFVHGDTTTTMASSIASFYSGAKVCHVEAGLRTYNKLSPFPEEINRQITTRISDYNFAPTETSKNNLLKENINERSIILTGNTVIDALLETTKKVKNLDNVEVDYLKNKINFNKRIILVTGHRRESHGQGFINICAALREIATNNPNVEIVYPVHLNPNVANPVTKLLGDINNIFLVRPLSYPTFVWLMNKSFLIITDSGGVQEEAPSLGKPVLVIRDITERPEAVQAGTVKMVGTDIKKIISETQVLLDNADKYEIMSCLHNPYGDGKASLRIREFISGL